MFPHARRQQGSADYYLVSVHVARQAYAGNEGSSIHMRTYAPIAPQWSDDALAAKWATIRKIRSVVTSAIEQARNDGEVGGSLQAISHLYLADEQASLFADQDMAALFITSAAHIAQTTAPENAFKLDDVAGVAVVIEPASGGKCGRCWKVLEEVTETKPICGRCDDVIAAQ